MAEPVSQGGIDYPDGGFSSGQEVYPMTSDLAELAVRLGIPSSIDRRGNVVLIEDFRYGGTATSHVTAGLGETIELSSKNSRYGGYSLLLHRAEDEDSYAGVYVRSAAVGTDRIGGEVLFAIEDHLPNLKLYLAMSDGTNQRTWGLRWDMANEKAYVGVDNTGYEELEGQFKVFTFYNILHSMKLVVSVEDEDYVRAYIDGQLLTVPSKAPYESAHAYTPNIALTFYNALDPTTDPKVFVDAIIITRNEPE